MKDEAAAEEKTTDRIRQRKKMMLHKLCIDMERSEYTSFSMLAMLKYESHWTSILISLTWIRGDEVERVGTVLEYPPFLRPLFD